MIVGVILAGGRSSRMGGRDKAQARLGGETLLDRVAARLASQVADLAINAPTLPDEARPDLVCIPDLVEGHQGPLAGIHAGLTWAAGLPGASHLATVSVDTPFLPADFVARLKDALAEKGPPLALASSGGRLHPTCGLWSVTLLPALEALLAAGDTRKVTAFANTVGYARAEFPTLPFDPFFNVNTPDDLDAALAILEATR